jgi:3-dehydroquinate dehydratase-2
MTNKALITVINGPNLNLLGQRDSRHYGSETLAEIITWLEQKAAPVAALSWLQSNVEGEIVNFIQAAAQNSSGIVINPGAYSHYSLAIHDALLAVSIPAIEVHLSNIHGREEMRQRSLTAAACRGQISGLGKYGYWLACLALLAEDEANKCE